MQLKMLNQNLPNIKGKPKIKFLKLTKLQNKTYTKKTIMQCPSRKNF